ncbi:MAG: hypothetical protein RJB62_13 [Pseudomonadota bacterium]|jgi:hypothetical protein
MKTQTQIISATTFLFLAAVAFSALGIAQAEEADASDDALTDEQQEIEDFLFDEGSFLESDGFTFERMDFASGPEGPAFSEEFLLTEGVVYAFFAKCEMETCGGVGVSLGDEDGVIHTETNDMGEDVKFGFQPTESGTFIISVDILSCSEAPCDVGLALYRGSLPTLDPVEAQ